MRIEYYQGLIKLRNVRSLTSITLYLVSYLTHEKVRFSQETTLRTPSQVVVKPGADHTLHRSVIL